MPETTHSPTLGSDKHKPKQTIVYGVLEDTVHRIIVRKLAEADGPLSRQELTRETLTDEQYSGETDVSILEGLMVDIYLPVLEAKGVITTDPGYKCIQPGDHHELYLAATEAVDEVHERYPSEV
jgi:hypothetical protein